MRENLKLVLLLFLAGIAACGIYQVLARYVVTYRLAPTTFDVTLFGVLPFLRFR